MNLRLDYDTFQFHQAGADRAAKPDGQRQPMWRRGITDEQKAEIKRDYEQEMVQFWRRKCQECPEDEEAAAELACALQDAQMENNEDEDVSGMDDEDWMSDGAELDGAEELEGLIPGPSDSDGVSSDGVDPYDSDSELEPAPASPPSFAGSSSAPAAPAASLAPAASSSALVPSSAPAPAASSSRARFPPPQRNEQDAQKEKRDQDNAKRFMQVLAFENSVELRKAQRKKNPLLYDIALRNDPVSRNNLWEKKLPVGMSVANSSWVRKNIKNCDGSQYPLRLSKPPNPWDADPEVEGSSDVGTGSRKRSRTQGSADETSSKRGTAIASRPSYFTFTRR